MNLTRIQISNFRNFSSLDISLASNAVIVGENRVGKSNLVHALRLIFDAGLPESARQLILSDFWDGLSERSVDDKIVVSVEIENFENDPDILAILTDFRLDDDPETVRLTYEFRPVADIEHEPGTADDYEFVCYGGESEQKIFGHRLRRRITMDVLPALRDSEGDLSNWKRSPLRPLIEDAFSKVSVDDLQDISDSITEATDKIKEFPEVSSLETHISTLFKEMSGEKQDIKPSLGFSPTDATRLFRSLRLLIDDGMRGIGDASLGSANLVFLNLKLIEIKKHIDDNHRDHTLLTVEEPEAHLHPHLQRSVYRHIFEAVQNDYENNALSIILTTHSPHIASVAPLDSIILLKDAGDEGTTGKSVKAIGLEENESEDIARYLDVTRAEMLFARGVILVEGDAEKYLLPTFAKSANISFDLLGITVCSVSGTNFLPYVKFLEGLGIPYSVITDWDPREGKKPLGYNRSLKLAKYIVNQREPTAADDIIESLIKLDYMPFCEECENYGIFSNIHTLEVDMFEDEFAPAMIAVLREHKFSEERAELIDQWDEDHNTIDKKVFLAMIETIGKGRYAQRLASHCEGVLPPAYINAAIQYVVDDV